MDKETVIIVVAQNGLKTASALFTSKSAKLEKQAAKVEYCENKLQITSLDRERFSIEDDIPEDIRNKKITVKLKSGLKKEIEFKAIS